MIQTAGAVVAAVVAVAAIFLCILMAVGGIVCLIVFAKRDSAGRKPGAVLPILSAVLMGVGGTGVYVVLYVAAIVIGSLAGSTTFETEVAEPEYYVSYFDGEYLYCADTDSNFFA